MFKLSICIPTYNRRNAVYALANKILLIERHDVELVILDNASTDNTVQLLKSIADPRISIHVNAINMGVLHNVVSVLTHARGIYSVLLLDKDDINIYEIDDFINFLSEALPTCGINEYTISKNRTALTLQKGIKSLQTIGYSCHHPTGYFFLTDFLLKLDITKRFLDYDFVGHFPFEFMQAELALLGSTAVYHSNLFTPEKLDKLKSKKSVGTNARNEEAFFSPNGRLKMAINFALHISTLQLTKAEKTQLIQICFYKGLIEATIGYRNILASAELSHHYHIETRHITIFKMIVDAFGFIIKYLQACKNHQELNHINLISLIFSRTISRRFRQIKDIV